MREMERAAGGPELALRVEDLEGLEAPSMSDFEAGVGVGLALVALGVATFAIVT